jgi:hypothetical protein
MSSQVEMESLPFRSSNIGVTSSPGAPHRTSLGTRTFPISSRPYDRVRVIHVEVAMIILPDRRSWSGSTGGDDDVNQLRFTISTRTPRVPVP